MTELYIDRREMANILVNANLDMDFANHMDSIDDYEMELDLIEKELQKLVDNDCDGLISILTQYVHEKEGQKDWIKTTDWWKERVESKMMAYCQIVNMIDNIASHGRAATTDELREIKGLAKEYKIDIGSFADANDCGNCFTWEEIIGAFRCLWASGERV